MTKNRRLEIRLSDEEYEAFEARAQELGVGLSEAVRQSLIPAGLSDGPRSFVKGAIDAAMSPKGHPHIEEAAREASERSIDPKEITRLARQRHGHLPLGLAERRAREELDADS